MVRGGGAKPRRGVLEMGGALTGLVFNTRTRNIQTDTRTYIHTVWPVQQM